MNEFYSVLKAIRHESGLNQRDFAEKVGMKPAAYNMVESGRNQPSYTLLNTLVNVFRLDANRFFQQIDNKETKSGIAVEGTTSNNFHIKIKITSEAEFLNQVHDYIRKIEMLYQRLIDIRLLLLQELRLNGELSTPAEADLLNKLARPELIIKEDETKLYYPYENLSNDAKTEYLRKLESCLQLFTNTFIECFEQLYKGIRIPHTKELREMVLQKREKLTDNWKYTNYIKHKP